MLFNADDIYQTASSRKLSSIRSVCLLSVSQVSLVRACVCVFSPFHGRNVEKKRSVLLVKGKNFVDNSNNFVMNRKRGIL